MYIFENIHEREITDTQFLTNFHYNNWSIFDKIHQKEITGTPFLPNLLSQKCGQQLQLPKSDWYPRKMPLVFRVLYSFHCGTF